MNVLSLKITHPSCRFEATIVQSLGYSGVEAQLMSVLPFAIAFVSQ